MNSGDSQSEDRSCSLVWCYGTKSKLILRTGGCFLSLASKANSRTSHTKTLSNKGGARTAFYKFSVSAKSSPTIKDAKKATATPATVCSPCCHLEKDTEVSAAAPPDYRAASLPRLQTQHTIK